MSEVNIADHDILKTKEDCCEESYDSVVRFVPGSYQDVYKTGSIFLSLRRRKVVKTEFNGRTFKKEFDEIALSPDGRIGVFDRIRSSRLL